jgi:hypothetical protein
VLDKSIALLALVTLGRASQNLIVRLVTPDILAIHKVVLHSSTERLIVAVLGELGDDCVISYHEMGIHEQ